jgi:hypothetical protein
LKRKEKGRRDKKRGEEKRKGRRDKTHSNPMSYLTNTKSQKGLDLERGIKEG